MDIGSCYFFVRIKRIVTSKRIGFCLSTMSSFTFSNIIYCECHCKKSFYWSSLVLSSARFKKSSTLRKDREAPLGLSANFFTFSTLSHYCSTSFAHPNTNLQTAHKTWQKGKGTTNHHMLSDMTQPHQPGKKIWGEKTLYTNR